MGHWSDSVLSCFLHSWWELLVSPLMELLCWFLGNIPGSAAPPVTRHCSCLLASGIFQVPWSTCRRFDKPRRHRGDSATQLGCQSINQLNQRKPDKAHLGNVRLTFCQGANCTRPDKAIITHHSGQLHGLPPECQSWGGMISRDALTCMT
ncbi:Hypothetical predicted protein [Podarcis lilfordi]|uniref:Uncharacterized protein n=1 Tax=Podarcis lilfordi TaxID=74358 RepID=A0AA35PRA9_9SAUR|nr:Hypothetical predicted protein [Podarcis lilfordi]